MTRDEPDLTGVVVYGSDHLTAYNLYAEAVNQYGMLGQVYGLPRHLFDESVDEWAGDRGVLVKAIEDIALGMASVYRTIERPLPDRLPMAGRTVLRRFQDLLAQVMPFDLTIDGESARGDRVRLSDSSMCERHGAVIGTIRYFADRFGVPRGAIEGTNLPFESVKRYARREPPDVEFREFRRGEGLAKVQTVEYHGFVLDRQRQPLTGEVDEDLLPKAREAMARALIEGKSRHPNRSGVARAARQLDEYWRRSGGTMRNAARWRVLDTLVGQLQSVTSWEQFLETPLTLDVDAMVSRDDRERLDALPASATVLGDRVAIDYRVEGGRATASLRLREKQARRLRPSDLPEVPFPLTFTVIRGRKEVGRAASLEELETVLNRLSVRQRQFRGGHGRRRRGR
jgi:hypothetical protein